MSVATAIIYAATVQPGRKETPSRSREGGAKQRNAACRTTLHLRDAAPRAPNGLPRGASSKKEPSSKDGRDPLKWSHSGPGMFASPHTSGPTPGPFLCPTQPGALGSDPLARRGAQDRGLFPNPLPAFEGIEIVAPTATCGQLFEELRLAATQHHVIRDHRLLQ